MLGKTKVIALGLALALTACVTTEDSVKKEASGVTKELMKGPESAPVKTVTNFTNGLRCMDNVFLMYGVRDLVVITEDLSDNTKKVSAGTKDMLISSVSEMTKRSRAIRLIAYGADSSNLIGFMKEAETKDLFKLRPQYGIRGSISQLDENVAKKTEGGGIAIEPFIGVGRAATAASTILGMDLTMMRTEDLSIVPGVTSSNSVVIFKSGSGVEGEAGYSKFGINYQSNLSRSEGSAQALRNLVQLATMELFGKLTKTPYWICMGATSQSVEVKNEITDWYSGMSSDGEIVPYWQQQMRIRGLYSGEINGQIDDALISAITAYSEALGLGKSSSVDLNFFSAYLDANHNDVAPKAREKLASYNKPSVTADNRPISLSIVSTKGSNQFKRGERITLKVTPSRDSYLYCFMQDETKKITRFFPNRFAKDSLISSKRGLTLPNNKDFNINANNKGVQEKIACYGVNHDVFADSGVIETIGGDDIENPIKLQTWNELKAVFEKAGGASLGAAEFAVNVN